MPASRPRTAAEARTGDPGAGDDGLTEAWAAEAPFEPDWRKTPGAESDHPCSKCGKPMRWTAAHTALICLACPLWSVSPGAHARSDEHLAAIDKSAARKSAPLADPAAERAAAERLAEERAEVLDSLEDAAEVLDVSDFPREEPYAQARAAGVRISAVVASYIDRAKRADTLDQIARINNDAYAYLKRHEAWAARIDELRDDLDQADNDPRPTGKVVRGRVLDDDDDYPEPTGRQLAPQGSGWAVIERQAPPRGAIAAPAADHLTPPVGPWCEQCRREHRYVNGRWPLAVARVEPPAGQPSQDICLDHFLTAQAQHGAALGLAEWFPAAPGGLRLSYENQRRERAGLPPLTPTQVMSYAGPGLQSRPPAVPRSAGSRFSRGSR